MKMHWIMWNAIYLNQRSHLFLSAFLCHINNFVDGIKVEPSVERGLKQKVNISCALPNNCSIMSRIMDHYVKLHYMYQRQPHFKAFM